MLKIPKTPKTFIQMCEDLAEKRAAGTIPKEQIEAMETFRKGLTSGYKEKTAKEIAEIKNFAPSSKIAPATDDSFRKSTAET